MLTGEHVMKIDAYVCPDCGGMIRTTLIEDEPGFLNRTTTGLTREPGDTHTLIWSCRSCFREFGPEWSVSIWGPSVPGTVLVGLKEWLERNAFRQAIDVVIAVAPAAAAAVLVGVLVRIVLMRLPT
jgi:hypothetical protein